MRLVKVILKTFAILIDSGYKTYGLMTDDQLVSKAKLYALILGEHKTITEEIVQATAMRYAKGLIWCNKNGETVPIGNDFPTASEFLEACKQTFHELYKMVSGGEVTKSDGCVYVIPVWVKRDASETEILTAINEARKTNSLPPMTLSEEKPMNKEDQHQLIDKLNMKLASLVENKSVGG